MTDTITSYSTYETCIAQINAAVQEFLLDQAEADLSEDEVWTDMAAALLIDASERVAREVCRVQLGFVPQDLEEHWRRRAQAKAAASRERAVAKAAEKREARAAAEKAADAAAKAAERASLCGTCFTIPAANGRCLCM